MSRTLTVLKITSRFAPPTTLEGMGMGDQPKRTVLIGHLSRDTRIELIVAGPFGVTEIEYLIRKLKIDKEILCENEERPKPNEGDAP